MADLTAERDEARAVVVSLLKYSGLQQDRIVALTAERDALRKALEPFAERSANLIPQIDEDYPISVPLRWLRRAHAVLGEPAPVENPSHPSVIAKETA